MGKHKARIKRKPTSGSALGPPKRNQEQPQEGPAASNLSPAERMAAALAMWEQLQDTERLELLTVSLQQLQQRAEALDAQSGGSTESTYTSSDGVEASRMSMVQQLQSAVTRHQSNQGMRLWSYQDILAHDAESFYSLICEKHVPQHLQQYLPKVDSCGLAATPAAAALQKPMCAVLAQIAEMDHQQAEDPSISSAHAAASSSSSYRLARKPTLDRISATSDAACEQVMHQVVIMASALEKEHEGLSERLLGPVAWYIKSCLPGRQCSNSMCRLDWEGLQELATEDLCEIFWWLRRNIERLCDLLGAKGAEAGQPGLQDVEMLTLSSDATALMPSPQWLQLLQSGTAQVGEQVTVDHPGRANLVVEWVYGNFLSAADSPRHMAKLQLNREAFTAVQAHKQLIQALQNQAKFDFPADMYKLLLSDLLQSRQIYQQLKLQYSIPKAPAAAGEQVATAVAAEAAENSIPTWPEALPVEAIIELLARGLLLARAKLAALQHEGTVQHKDLECLQSLEQQMILGINDLQTRAAKLNCKTSSDPTTSGQVKVVDEHQKQQIAALEKVHADLQRQEDEVHEILKKVQLARKEMSDRESSVKTVVAWISELEELRKQFQKVQLSPTDVLPDDPGSSSSGSHAPAGAKAVLGQSCSCQDAQCSSGAAANVTNKQGEEPLKNTEAAGEQAVGECALARAQLRHLFYQEILPRLYTESEDRKIFAQLMSALKYNKDHLAQGEVVIQYLKRELVDVACDDPGSVITKQLVLPLLQQQIDAAVAAYHQQKPARPALIEVLNLLRAAADDLDQATASGAATDITAAWQQLSAVLDKFEGLKCCGAINQLMRQEAAALAESMQLCVTGCLQVPSAQQSWSVMARFLTAYVSVSEAAEQLRVPRASRTADRQDLVHLQTILAAVADRLWAAATVEYNVSRSRGTARGLEQQLGLMSASLALLQLANIWLQHWPVEPSQDPVESYARAAAVAVTAADVAALLVNMVTVFDAAVAGAHDAAGLVSSPAMSVSMATAMTATKQLRPGLEHNSRAALSVTQLLLLLLDMQLQHEQGTQQIHTGTAAAVWGKASSKASSSSSSVSAVLPAAQTAEFREAKCLQQYHQKVLESIEGLTEASWQAGCRVVVPAQRSPSAVINTLLLLTRQLQQLGEWYISLFMNEDAIPHPHDPAVCNLLPSLVLLLLHLGASSSSQEGSRLLGVALDTAVAATSAWSKSLDAQPLMRGHERDCELQLSQAQEAMQLVYTQMQQAVGTSLTPNSSISSSNLELLVHWIDAAGSVQGLISNITTCQHESCITADVSYVPGALAAAEHCMRIAGQALCSTAGGAQCHNRLDAAVGQKMANAGWQLFAATRSIANHALSNDACGKSSKTHHFAAAVTYMKFAVQLAAMTGIFVEPELLLHEYWETMGSLSPDVKQQLSAAAPWLLLLARGFLVDVRQAATVAKRLQAEPEATNHNLFASSSNGAAATGQYSTQGQWHSRLPLVTEALGSRAFASAYEQLTDVHCAFEEVLGASEPQEPQLEQQQSLQTAKTAAGLQTSAAAVVRSHLAQLLQHLKQQLMPIAADVAQSLKTANNLSLQAQLVAESKTYGLPLLQQLEAAAEQLCALLPLPLCCNNPACSNMSMQSELLLVGGKACVCAGCEVARYCGRECQAAHWQAHKRVCRMIKDSRAAA